MHYGPDETLRRNRPFELPKGPVMLLDSLGIYGPNGNIQRRLRTEPCKNARSAACHTGHAEALLEVSKAAVKKKGKKTDVAELYF
jgi:hypothetical protein